VRLLLTADLHFKENWYRWLIEHQADFGLICMAGDLLDMFSPVPLLDQIEIVSLRLRALADKSAVAVSSGNHDAVPPASDPTWYWFNDLTSSNILTDGQSRRFGDILVTSVPWQVSESSARAILEAARKESPQFNKWLLLVHDVGRLEDAANLVRKLIIEFAPNYVITGHSHTLPYTRGSWFQIFHKTIIFTPGQLMTAPWPNHVLLDLSSGKAEWQTSARAVNLAEVLREEELLRGIGRRRM
jgi:hypothetical protein